MNTVFTFGGSNPYNAAAAMIEVKQSTNKRKRFTVTYGAEVTPNLTYSRAAKELGECIFHHLACEGLLDNQDQYQ